MMLFNYRLTIYPSEEAMLLMLHKINIVQLNDMQVAIIIIILANFLSFKAMHIIL